MWWWLRWCTSEEVLTKNISCIPSALEELWPAYKTLNQFTKAALKASLLAQQCREITCAKFLVVAVALMVFQFSGLCGCITEYFIPEVLRNVVISFSRAEAVSKNAKKDVLCLNILLGQFDPLKMRTPQNNGYQTTRKCGKPHNHHVALCYATLQTILLRAKWVSKFSPICIISF